MLDFTELLPHLDHVHYRSGQELAAHFNCTRATIHNCIARIDALGIQLERIPGRGYRLRMPLDLLDKESIVNDLAPDMAVRVHALECLQQVDSTNRVAVNMPLPPADTFSVVLAEMQSAGKGRRGRAWVSPYAANIYASIVWPTRRPLHELGGLSPYLAITFVEKLHALGLPGLSVKWPNDIHCGGKKLAGLLIECSGELSGVCKIVVGLGINVKMKHYRNIEIDREWTDIHSNAPGWRLTRNQLTAHLISACALSMRDFESNSVTGLSRRWARWDCMQNANVHVADDVNTQYGIARGIDAHGCLLLETDTGVEHISVGDVSLRESA